MPVIFTFDIGRAEPLERNRIQSFFERLGWQHVGGSCYRYPKLGTMDQPVEDWFNHVIPALMLFRAYILQSRKRLRAYTIDVQTSAGLRPRFGHAPLRANRVTLYKPTKAAFGKRQLLAWLDNTGYPYTEN